MAIPMCIRRQRTIGATSTRSVRAPATTRANAAPKHYSSIIGGRHKLRIKVARIFNTYGPRMHPNDGRVVSNFIVQALLGRDITVFGDGLQTRSFCYVDDLIDGLVRLMNTSDEVIGPINIGNPKEFTILELASLVIELTGSRSRMVHRPLPQDDPKQRRPDISMANDVLAWAPRTMLKDGLIKTITYFEELLRDETIRQHISTS